jgi:hypothetical protein
MARFNMIFGDISPALSENEFRAAMRNATISKSYDFRRGNSDIAARRKYRSGADNGFRLSMHQPPG